ncbi:MAG: hypothetical protein Q4Q58_02225 [Thermoplasmata archaeon]|nr:hypothetical protein [Thermoplasmata archaeon]
MASACLWNIRPVLYAAIAVMALHIAMNAVRIRLDERFEAPPSASATVTGMDTVVLWLPEYIFGTEPIHVFSGGKEVATMYRGSGTTVLIDAGSGVRISREDEVLQFGPDHRVATDRINLITEERCLRDFHVRQVDSLEDADTRMMKAYYEKIRSDAVEGDLSATCMLLTGIALLLAVLMMLP